MSAAYTAQGARSRPSLRKARAERYFARAVPAPTTTRQAEILNPALIAAPTDEEGVVIGRDVLSNSAVAHDPFTAYQNKVITSPAVVILGVIGSGKSSLIKTVYVLRPIILKGRRAVVMDKKDREGEGEYAELTRQLGGEPFGFRIGGGGTVINPLDPLITEVLGRHGQFGLLRAMAERAAGTDSLGTWQMKALRSAHLEVLRTAEQDGSVPLIGNLAQQLDVQHAVHVARALDADVVGQGELALERAGRDAAVQVGVLPVILGLAGRHDHGAVLHLDVQVVGREAGDGDRDAIGVLARLFDVVGGIGRGRDVGRQRPVHQVRHAVEADRGAVERGKIHVTHVRILQKRCELPPPGLPGGPHAGASSPAGTGMNLEPRRPRSRPCGCSRSALARARPRG